MGKTVEELGDEGLIFDTVLFGLGLDRPQIVAIDADIEHSILAPMRESFSHLLKFHFTHIDIFAPQQGAFNALFSMGQ